MKRTAPIFLSVSICCMVSSCDTATPEDYFSRAVLNCNVMSGFAGNGMRRQLEQPSVKLADSSGSRTVQMTRKEVVDDKIRYLEDALAKVRKLKETDDTREMLQASVAVYDYVLPVYRNEYLHLAKLYDEGAGKNEIEAMNQAISSKYLAGFQLRMESLTAAGKPFAERHGINVRWDVRTSPSP